jgi:ABC-type nitrate/sulfonate/bicarbonate transport system ATPase subunit
MAVPPPAVVVRAQGLTKVFRDPRHRADVVALEAVDLSLADGEFVTLIGPSGCGKSTLLFMVAGFEPPSEGTLTLDGRPITGPGPDRGVVFQEYALFPWLTVLENVGYGLREQGHGAGRSALARRYVELVGLQGFEGRHPHELSGGMRQRVALARVLAINPRILLMDEPFAALDEQTRFSLQAELLDVWEAERKTVLFVTHSIEEAVFLSDRVIVMTARPGRIRSAIAVDLARPRDRTSDEFNAVRRRLSQALSDRA